MPRAIRCFSQPTHFFYRQQRPQKRLLAYHHVRIFQNRYAGIADSLVYVSIDSMCIFIATQHFGMATIKWRQIPSGFWCAEKQLTVFTWWAIRLWPRKTQKFQSDKRPLDDIVFRDKKDKPCRCAGQWTKSLLCYRRKGSWKIPPEPKV